MVAGTRAAWAAHVICYEQHLRAMKRDSVEWLGTFSASLQDATRAHLSQLLTKEYPDTLQLVAACISPPTGIVRVADEFWEGLPLADMTNGDIRTIECEIVSLYARTLEDGRDYRGALGASMEDSAGARIAIHESTAPPPVSNRCPYPRELHVALRPMDSLLPGEASRGCGQGSQGRRSI